MKDMEIHLNLSMHRTTLLGTTGTLRVKTSIRPDTERFATELIAQMGGGFLGELRSSSWNGDWFEMRFRSYRDWLFIAQEAKRIQGWMTIDPEPGVTASLSLTAGSFTLSFTAIPVRSDEPLDDLAEAANALSRFAEKLEEKEKVTS
jgi:hypothetical protein